MATEFQVTIDCADPHTLAGLRRAYPHALCVSAKTGEGLDALRDAISGELARLTGGGGGAADPHEDAPRPAPPARQE